MTPAVYEGAAAELAVAVAAAAAAAVDKDGENKPCNAEEDTSSSAVVASWPWRRRGTASPSIAADTAVVGTIGGGGVVAGD